MSTSPISLPSIADQMQLQQNRRQQLNQDFKQLSTSLQSGDVAAAQKAYSALQQLLPNQAQNSQPGADFTALGQALQSGDLSSAQSAFSQLTTDLTQGASSATGSSLMKALHGHHGHHHVATPPDSDSSGSNETGVNLLA